MPRFPVVRGRVAAGESSQQPMCPQAWHMRRCTHRIPSARHSSDLHRALGLQQPDRVEVRALSHWS